MLLHIYFCTVWFYFKLKTELKSFLKWIGKMNSENKKKEIPFSSLCLSVERPSPACCWLPPYSSMPRPSARPSARSAFHPAGPAANSAGAPALPLCSADGRAPLHSAFPFLKPASNRTLFRGKSRPTAILLRFGLLSKPSAL